jgi:hypothetical protein
MLRRQVHPGRFDNKGKSPGGDLLAESKKFIFSASLREKKPFPTA